MPLSTSTPPVSDHELRSFLLGRLDEDERQRLEERLLIDDGLFELALAHEDELFEEAARGELSAEDTSRLTARGGERLAFAHDLARRAEAPGEASVIDFAARAQEMEDGAPPVRPPASRAGALRWLAVAALLPLTVGLGLYLTRPSDPAPSPGTPGIDAFVLPPGALRQDGETPSLRIEQPGVLIYLELETGDGSASFGAVLRDARNVPLRRWPRLRVETFDWGRAVVLELTAAELPAGAYRLELTPQEPAGIPRLYHFRVER